ncbi:MAG: heat-inducible transcription repressor HrcA [Chloroflexi bacterium]|nr:heat-inducible transcription repressor HrcA [Chloroflexota bacterium]
MLSARTGTILKHIVEQYIDRAAPVPSLNIAHNSELKLSPATIRNEMALLEQEGYLFRPHTSAGSVPSDKGYRYYVELLKGVKLSPAEQRLISHLFHQVEREVDEWLGLAATLLSQLVKNVAVVSIPRPVDCKFKHVELVALQDTLALLVLVLIGAKVKEKLVNFDRAVSQVGLSAIAGKLNATYSGLTRRQILVRNASPSPGNTEEQQITGHLLRIMQGEDEREHEEARLDGWHFILGQPEFSRSDRMQPLMELVEHRSLLKSIVPQGLEEFGVRVVIGRENREAAIQNYSVVICRYGLPDEATGTIGVVGPTRMHYARTIPTVDYISSVLTDLVAGLFGRGTPADLDKHSSN